MSFIRYKTLSVVQVTKIIELNKLGSRNIGQCVGE